MGQYRTTYISSKHGTPLDESRRLQTAVTVRAQREDKDGTWIQDESTYAPKTGVKPGTTKVFSLFDGFQHKKKHPTAVENLFAKILLASRAPCNGTSSNVPLDPVQNTQPIAPEEDVFGPSVPALSVEPLQPMQQASSRSLVENWRDGVMQAQQEEGVRCQAEEMLISFDEPQETPRRESELLAAAHQDMEMCAGPLGRRTNDARGGFDTSDDLICLEPASQSRPPHQPPSTSASLQQPSQMPPSMSRHAPVPERSLDQSMSLLDLAVPPLACLDIKHAPTPVLVTSSPRPPEPAESTTSTRQPSRKSHILKLAEAGVKDLASILELAPGQVSIELEFGRFYMKNLSHSLIDVGSGPHWTMADMLESLNADDVPGGCVGFSTALTSCGPDVEDLVKLCPRGEAPWVHFETKVWYEVFCVPEDQEPFIVEIDADSFRTNCRGVEKELGHLYLHCVRRPWDMRVRVAQKTALNHSPLHVAIADALVASICVA